VIEVARAAATSLEAEAVPGWLWQAAIHQGFRAMSLLGQNDGGYLVADLDARELAYRKGADRMTPWAPAAPGRAS
jgi:hypothetical protein